MPSTVSLVSNVTCELVVLEEQATILINFFMTKFHASQRIDAKQCCWEREHLQRDATYYTCAPGIDGYGRQTALRSSKYV